MKKKAAALMIIPAVAALATVGVLFNKTPLMQTVGTHSYARQMVFNSLYRSAVTSNGNTFSAFWVEQLDGSSFSDGLATITGVGYFNGSKFYSYSSILGIKGEYDISNISTIEITYSIKTTNTTLYVGTLSEDNKFEKHTEAGSVLSTPFDAERTCTINDLESVHGLAFALEHHPTAGSNGDAMTATIKSVKINYTC